MYWKATGRHKHCLVCPTWRKIYLVYSVALFETHSAKRMSAAYVNSEYPDQFVNRHRQIRAITFYQNLTLKVPFKTEAAYILLLFLNLFLRCCTGWSVTLLFACVVKGKRSHILRRATEDTMLCRVEIRKSKNSIV